MIKVHIDKLLRTGPGMELMIRKDLLNKLGLIDEEM